jgi:hypothetical protein
MDRRRVGAALAGFGAFRSGMMDQAAEPPKGWAAETFLRRLFTGPAKASGPVILQAARLDS